jgi:predicted CopG family antitoxin
MVTTIKMHLSTKKELDLLRDETESYDQVISKLVAEHKHKDLRRALIEGYTQSADFDRKTAKEWETSSTDW